jgi:hypothetical protein
VFRKLKTDDPAESLREVPQAAPRAHLLPIAVRIIQRSNSGITAANFPAAGPRFVDARAGCRGQRVVDIGCVDSGSLEERASSGELMHQGIAGVAKAMGADIDLQGIDRLATTWGHQRDSSGTFGFQ